MLAYVVAFFCETLIPLLYLQRILIAVSKLSDENLKDSPRKIGLEAIEEIYRTKNGRF